MMVGLVWLASRVEKQVVKREPLSSYLCPVSLPFFPWEAGLFCSDHWDETTTLLGLLFKLLINSFDGNRCWASHFNPCFCSGLMGLSLVGRKGVRM